MGVVGSPGQQMYRFAYFLLPGEDLCFVWVLTRACVCVC